MTDAPNRNRPSRRRSELLQAEDEQNNGISEARQPKNRQQPVRLKEPGRAEESLLAASSPRALQRRLIGGNPTRSEEDEKEEEESVEL